MRQELPSAFIDKEVEAQEAQRHATASFSSQGRGPLSSRASSPLPTGWANLTHALLHATHSCLPVASLSQPSAQSHPFATVRYGKGPAISLILKSTMDESTSTSYTTAV